VITETAFVSPRREKDPDKCEMGGNMRNGLFICIVYAMKWACCVDLKCIISNLEAN